MWPCGGLDPVMLSLMPAVVVVLAELDMSEVEFGPEVCSGVENAVLAGVGRNGPAVHPGAIRVTAA